MTIPIRNSRIRLSQGQLFWREVGQGKTLVFLHGSWSDGNQWLGAIEPLSQRYHCVAPDLLGFGESEQPKVHYSIEQQVECLAEYLEVLKLRQIYLVGESIGGWIAASYVLRFPDQVKGLVLLSPEGISTEYRWRWERWLVSPLANGLLRSILPVARLLGREGRIEHLLRWQRQLRRSPVACKLLFGRRQAEIQAESLNDRLQWLKLPVLLLQGEGDRAAALTQGFLNQAPTAELQQVSEPLTASLDSVAVQIQAFIERID